MEDVIASVKCNSLFIVPQANNYKSAARFCHQVAAWVPDMFCNFYLGKNHKIANNSTTTKTR